ncbi:ThuA domain-containing protein [Balneolales bacterium ANBcel1]|nr:ThuA domain-containing protein [Balneolales bacterium ANBcel1]
MNQKKSRRNFLKSSIAGGAGLLMAPGSLLAGKYAKADDQPAPSLEGKKVLYVYGGWEGHEPKESVDLFVPWMRSEGADVTVSDTLDAYLDESLMESLDLIVQIVTMSEITQDQERILLKTIKNGAGISGWHGGLCDSFRQNTEYQFMTGGQWVSHPGNIIDYRVNIVDHTDRVTRGLSDFDVHTEQYYMHVDPNVKVLATTRFSGEHAPWIDGSVMPIAWKKYYGDGRVFYSSLGHTMDVFDVPEAWAIQQRGIRWAAESKYHPYEEWISPVYK